MNAFAKTHAWRIIDSGPLDAYENMALDEALLDGFCNSPQAPAIFRIYQWKSAAFSIGVSQDPRKSLDLEKCRAEGLPYVRRMSGGGIIFHDREITYSLVMPKTLPGLPEAIAESFKKICSFLVLFYRKLGLDAKFALDQPDSARTGSAQEFCFASREKYDIVIAGKKIGGNAQKRTQRAIFQHGSIPLAIDRKRIAQFVAGDCQSELSRVTALGEVSSRLGKDSELIGLLKESFRESFNVAEADSVFNAEELFLAEKLKQEKYSSDSWNIQRYRYALHPEKAGLAE